MKKYSGLSPIENSITEIIKPIFLKKRDDFLIISYLNKNWSGIVGEKFFQFCKPKKVKFSNRSKNKKNSKTLYINAYNPSIAFYLEANSNLIIEKIASYYGYKIIDEIKIFQELTDIESKNKKPEEVKINKEDEKRICDLTTKIKDPELKSAITRLGMNIISDK